MVSIKRCGFKKRSKLSETKIDEAIRSLRSDLSAELANRRRAPAAQGGANPRWKPTSRVSGPTNLPPVELTNIDYVLDGAELRAAVDPANPPFGGLLPQEECGEVGGDAH